MRLRRALPAGLLDAGMASAATFAVSLEAARRLEPAALGAYALVFTAFLLMAVVPAQLVFTPVEVAAARRDTGVAGFLPSSLRLGLPVAAVAALAVLAVTAVIPADVPTATVRPLVLTAAVAALLSPVQDHLRRMLHVAGASWSASAVSAVQLVVVVGALVVLSAAGVATAWLPFGALAIANAISAATAFLLLLRRRDGATPHLSRQDVTRSGRWLLVVGLAPAAAAFLAATLVSSLAGAAALGHAEAARVVAQPLLVVGVGLGAALGPRSVSAAHRGASDERRRLRRTFLVVLAGLGLVLLALVGHAWTGNPAALLIPNAYVVPGLVAITLAANVLNGLAFPYRYELLGLGRERSAASSEVLGGVAQVLTSCSAALTGAAARPLSLAVLGLLRLALFSGALTAASSGAPGRGAEQVPPPTG